jgi:hypothetical protein
MWILLGPGREMDGNGLESQDFHRRYLELGFVCQAPIQNRSLGARLTVPDRPQKPQFHQRQNSAMPKCQNSLGSPTLTNLRSSKVRFLHPFIQFWGVNHFHIMYTMLYTAQFHSVPQTSRPHVRRGPALLVVQTISSSCLVLLQSALC